MKIKPKLVAKAQHNYVCASKWLGSLCKRSISKEVREGGGGDKTKTRDRGKKDIRQKSYWYWHGGC
jgi:hypothetical protein